MDEEGVKPEQERSNVASLAHGLHDDAGYIMAKQAAPHDTHTHSI
jgi:hypothetical protein